MVHAVAEIKQRQIKQRIDLANCDSCGTCAVPAEKPTVKVHIEERYLFVEGDVIDIGYIKTLR